MITVMGFAQVGVSQWFLPLLSNPHQIKSRDLFDMKSEA